MSQPEVIAKVSRDPFTHVTASQTVEIGGVKQTIIGQGFAKRNMADAPNQIIGEELAKSRAFLDIKRQRDERKMFIRNQRRNAQLAVQHQQAKEHSKLKKLAAKVTAEKQLDNNQNSSDKLQ